MEWMKNVLECVELLPAVQFVHYLDPPHHLSPQTCSILRMNLSASSSGEASPQTEQPYAP